MELSKKCPKGKIFIDTEKGGFIEKYIFVGGSKPFLVF
jgi:hypothetical protein